MTKVSKSVLFLFVAINLSFSMLAMDGRISSGASVSQFDLNASTVRNINDLQGHLGENQWLLYNKKSNNGIIVDIDLLVNCDGCTTEQMNSANETFTQSLLRRIDTHNLVKNGVYVSDNEHEEMITRFTIDNVHGRVIPYDISDDALNLFVDVLRMEKLFRNVCATEYYQIRNQFEISITNRISKTSLEQLVQCTNFFNDLGIFAETEGRFISLPKDFFITGLYTRINNEIRLWLELVEDTFADIFKAEFIVPLQKIEDRYKDCSDYLTTYNNYDSLDQLTKKDMQAIKSAIVFPRKKILDKQVGNYFDDILETVVKDKDVTADYYENVLKMNLYGHRLLLQEKANNISIQDLIMAIKIYVKAMMNLRGGRDNNIKTWRVTKSSQESSEKREMLNHPKFLSTSQSDPSKGTSWKEILVILAATGAGAYLLYKYLMNKE